MSVQGPLVLLQTRYHEPDGIVSPEALVQAVRDAGFEVAALADSGTLRGAPAFLAACGKAGIHPLLGATLPVGPPTRSTKDHPIDVLSLQDSPDSPTENAHEPVVLLATNRRGYRNLLALLDRYRGHGLEPFGMEALLENREGLFLIVGLPGSPLAEVVAGHRPWTTIAWIEPLLRGWPKARLAFGGLYPLSDEHRTARILSRLKRIPVSLAPIALSVAAYRNENDRFWGLAKGLQQDQSAKGRGTPFRLVENREAMSRNLQGLSRALRLVEKLSVKESDLSEALVSPPPIYPTPRGTDTNSFFWTLVQEAAISTGHIRTPGGKERLYEEFQYLKQTPWPGLWLLLWDLRRRMGLPPGTLRPTYDWLGASLSAHLLGLVRIDPLRERIPFQAVSGEEAIPPGRLVKVESPFGFEQEIERAAKALLGEGRVGVCVPASHWMAEDLARAGGAVLNRWEELGFGGDRPNFPPPPPAYLKEIGASSSEKAFSLLLAGAPLASLLPPSPDGFPFLDIAPEDALRSGATVFRFESAAPQTLAASARYRGEPATPSPAARSRTESITEWVEDHRGETFQGEAYADDTGKLEVLGYSSCLLRLLTFPGSAAYRPLLAEWIRRAAPRNLGALASLLALGWHWSYWSGRPDWKKIAARRSHPLLMEEKVPPWWAEWEQFVETSTLESRLAGSLGAALEKSAEPTGGWLLFQDQIVGAVEEGLALSPEEAADWLRFEDSKDSAETERNGEGSRLRSRKVRQAFQTFLGAATRFPWRIDFLKRAEALLSAAEGFHRDPAAVTALLSRLFPEEREERRELYEILRERGKRLELPGPGAASPFDRSVNSETLTLGFLNILGVGPRIAEVLAPGWELGVENLKRLFAPTEVSEPLSWSAWLAERSRRPVDWKILTSLIQLGVCDCLGGSRTALVEEARAQLRKRSESGGAVQQTLFGLAAGPSGVEMEEEKAWNRCLDESYTPLRAELDWLRFSPSGNPLEVFGESIPAAWRSREKLHGETRWTPGWVLEVDVFEAPSERGDSETRRIWMTFRMFTAGKSLRVVDREGRLADSFPEPLPDEIGWEGRRIHLKGPWRIVCELRRVPAPGLTEYETCELVDAEPIEEIPPLASAWAGIEASLGEASSEAQEGLEQILRCFAHDVVDRSVPLVLVPAEGVFRKGPLRRLAARFGEVRVVGSALLARGLERLPGIEKVRLIPRQKGLFSQK